MAIIYVRGPNPIWFFNNLTGAVLDDTYWAFFLTNDLPYIPQAVYQDPNGISPWSDPIEFQPSGGLPNNLYFNPTQTYRIEIRQGPNQTDPLIWLVQNYVPGEGGSGGSTVADPLTVAANLITDPNFSDIYFQSPYTYTQASPGTYTVNVAPGWQLVLTGAGTTILTQGTFAGNSNTFGNPSYYLGINNTGWTSVILTQTLSNNGAIFANGAIAVAFTAQAITSGQAVIVNYVPNGTANSQTIVSAPVTTGGFVEYYGAIDLNASVNANTDGAANVQIQFVLPSMGNVQLTNIQVVGQSVPLSVNFITPPSAILPGSVPNYQELTYPQIVNAEFNVYKNSLLSQPKATILTGWDFSLNPWQFTSTTPTNVATNKYTADQTILIQQKYVTSATGNHVSVGQSSATYNSGYLVTAVTATNQFGILNYVDPITVSPYWGSIVSSMVTLYFGSPTHSTIGVQVKMRLIWNPSIPTSHTGGATQTYPVASWTAAGDPVFAAGFTAITPPDDPVYTLTANAFQQFAFNGIQLPANNGSSTQPLVLGVFLYTTGTVLNQNATADFIVINDVSLVQNAFALPSNPKTADEVFRECQYYYEQSFPSGAATPSNQNGMRQVNCQLVVNNGGNDNLTTHSFTVVYDTYKRIAVTPTFYAPATLHVSNVTLGINKPGVAFIANSADSAITNWTAFGATNTAYALQATTAGTPVAYATDPSNEGLLLYHYVADCRLGISST